MKEIVLRAEREYSVSFTETWREQLLSRVADRAFAVITQRELKDVVAAELPGALIIVTASGEEQKTVSSYSSVMEEIAALNLNRESLIVGIGGGATTDFAGFLAATYMRGIDWIAIPTSIAAMVDASIGGKTGINLAAGKNLAGAFHSPIEVIIDLNWLQTLSERDKRAGLAEAVKCGFISDKRILDLFQGGYVKNLPEIIHRSIQVKASIVSRDFKESYEREVLNYGHTLGHAIERDSNYQLRHGESISIGMIYAAELSQTFEGLDSAVVQLHYEILDSLNLPTSYKEASWPNLLDYMNKDKKRRAGAIRFVTLKEIGKTDRRVLAADDLEAIYKKKVGR